LVIDDKDLSARMSASIPDQFMEKNWLKILYKIGRLDRTEISQGSKTKIKDFIVYLPVGLFRQEISPQVLSSPLFICQINNIYILSIIFPFERLIYVKPEYYHREKFTI
jgi:hypothetical protein